jgi:hypothetical protein
MSFPPLHPLHIVNVTPREPQDPKLHELTEALSAAARNGEDCTQPLFERLQYQFESFLSAAITPALLHSMRAVVLENLQLVKLDRGLALIFEGCVLTDAELKPAANDPSRINTRWKTDFFPRNRWSRHPGDCMPLGFFGEYDLYIAEQSFGFAPTLIARYGDAPGQYGSFNSFVTDVRVLYAPDASDITLVYREAYERAQRIGAIESNS